jgi:hypothetical protein
VRAHIGLTNGAPTMLARPEIVTKARELVESHDHRALRGISGADRAGLEDWLGSSTASSSDPIRAIAVRDGQDRFTSHHPRLGRLAFLADAWTAAG